MMSTDLPFLDNILTSSFPKDLDVDSVSKKIQ